MLQRRYLIGVCMNELLGLKGAQTAYCHPQIVDGNGRGSVDRNSFKILRVKSMIYEVT